MKAIDLTGQQFGKLTVLERDTINPHKRTYWFCKCNCGNPNIISVSTSNLRTGHTKSCGCIVKEFMKNLGSSSKKDLTNQRFGKLLVLKEDTSDEYGHMRWICQCDCGNIISVRGDTLRRGESLSCGCLKSKGEQKITEILNKNNIKFEKQKTFETCRFPDTNALAKFDFYLPDYNYLIEYDGEQHFQETQMWTPLEKIQERDTIKNQWCEENNIKLIRIPYTKYKTLSLKDIIGEEN